MKLSLRRNMGTADRALRTIVGITLITIGPVTQAITPDKLSNVLFGIVGTLALVSAFFAYCVLYEVTGFGTGRK